MLYGGTRARGMAKAALAACALACLAAGAGCSSASGQPSWAASLGSGVTVVPPGTASPGNDSPDGVMIGVITAITTGHLTDFCKYEQPALQSSCNAGMSQVTAAKVKDQLPTFKNVKLAYTVIDRDKALIGLTGRICAKGKTQCFSNSDPAKLFKSGKPFGELWTEAVKAPPNVYSLSPAIKINGKWYAYTTSST